MHLREHKGELKAAYHCRRAVLQYEEQSARRSLKVLHSLPHSLPVYWTASTAENGAAIPECQGAGNIFSKTQNIHVASEKAGDDNRNDNGNAGSKKRFVVTSEREPIIKVVRFKVISSLNNFTVLIPALKKEETVIPARIIVVRLLSAIYARAKIRSVVRKAPAKAKWHCELPGHGRGQVQS